MAENTPGSMVSHKYVSRTEPLRVHWGWRVTTLANDDHFKAFLSVWSTRQMWKTWSWRPSDDGFKGEYSVNGRGNVWVIWIPSHWKSLILFPGAPLSFPPSMLLSHLQFLFSPAVFLLLVWQGHLYQDRVADPGHQREAPPHSPIYQHPWWWSCQLWDFLAVFSELLVTLSAFKLWDAFHKNKPAWSPQVVSSARIDYCKDRNSPSLKGKFMKGKLL